MLSLAPWNPLEGLSEAGRAGFVRGLIDELGECGANPPDPRFDALALTAESLFETSGEKAVWALVGRAYPGIEEPTFVDCIYSILRSAAGLPAPEALRGVVGPVAGTKLSELLEAGGGPDWKYDPNVMPPRLEETPWTFDSDGPSGYAMAAALNSYSLYDGDGNECLELRSGRVPPFQVTW